MKKIFLFVIIFIGNFTFGQLTVVPTDLNRINVKSANVSDMIKYGNLSSISNIGELNLNIPILSLPTSGNNSLGISLNYYGSGFRPSKRSGIVGYNWVLNVGGVISRTVNGMPDDAEGHAEAWTGDTNYADGFIIGVQNKTHNPTEVFNLTSNTSYEDGWSGARYMYGNSGLIKPHANNYETEPDTFNFNFSGISGSFFMGNDGIIKVVSNSPNVIKVDISQLANQPEVISTSKPNNSKIIITDELGNKYYFGGDLKNLEYTFSGSIDNNNRFVSGDRPIITSWFLYRIEYYNGKFVNYNYKSHDGFVDGFANEQTLQHGWANPMNDVLKDFLVFNESYAEDTSFSTDPGNAEIAKGPDGASYSLTKIAILDNIITDNYKITFKYQRQPHVFNNRTTTSDIFPLNKCSSIYNQCLDIYLEQINLFDLNTNLIQPYYFLYDHFGGDLNSRMFLKSIQEVGKPPHSFEYYPTGTLPKPITKAIDHWGYWNGTNDNTNRLIPIVNYNMTTGDYTFENNIDGTSREPNFNFALKGQLKKVIYPTAGYSEFEYESHIYSKKVDIRSANGFTPSIYVDNGTAGGTRIKKISDFDGQSLVNIKEYKYVSDFANGGTISSGVMLKWPRYHLYYSAAPISAANLTFFHRRSSPMGNIIENCPVISYSEVIETLNGNGFSVKKFSDFVSHPDLLDITLIQNRFPSNCSPQGLAINYVGNLLNDRSNERGKVLFEKIYNNSGILKESIDFEYNTDPNKFGLFATRLHISGPVTIANKIYYYNDFLTKKTTTSYESTGAITSVENFTYIVAPSYTTNNSDQSVLTKITTRNSLNDIIEKEYKYPWQIYTSGSTDFLNFKNANILIPLREITTKNAIKLNESFTVFKKDGTTNNLVFPKYSYTAKFPNNFPNIADIGNLEKKNTFDLYDTKGNITQFSSENDITTSIIWGYNKSLPIAKIENATLAQVATALGTTTTTLQTYNETNLSALNGLRSSLPNAMVTTYVHLPLIGVSTITDPKGDISTFTYDANNRLKNVKDKNGNVLSEYQYHYKNQ